MFVVQSSIDDSVNASCGTNIHFSAMLGMVIADQLRSCRVWSLPVGQGHAGYGHAGYGHCQWFKVMQGVLQGWGGWMEKEGGWGGWGVEEGWLEDSKWE